MHSSKKIFLLVTLFSVILGLMAEKSPIVAKFDDQSLTKDQLQAITKVTPFDMRMKYASAPDQEKIAQLYAFGMTLDPALKESILAKPAIAEKLQKERTAKLGKALYETDIVPQLEVPQSDMKEYYDKNIAEYSLPERYKMQHIFISGYVMNPKIYKVQKGDTARLIATSFCGSERYSKELLEFNGLKSDADLKEGMELKIPHNSDGERGTTLAGKEILEARYNMACYIQKKASAPDADFNELAVRFSQTDQDDKAEVIGPIPVVGSKKAMLDQILITLKSLKVGDVSPVVPTKHGFEIMKLVEVIPAEVKSFEDVKSKIELKLKGDRKKAVIETYINDLKKAPFIFSSLDILDQDEIADDAVLFSVGDYTLTYKEMMDELKTKRYYAQLSGDKAKMKQYVESLIVQKAVPFKAINDGLDKKPAFVNDMHNLETMLLADDALTEQSTAQAKVDDSEVKSFYDEHIADYKLTARMKIKQISMPFDEGNAVKAKGQIDAVYERLSKGADFSITAKEFSADKFAKSGGNTGFIVESSSPEFFAQLQSVLPGNYTAPFKSKNNYYILQLISKESARTKSFDEVSGSIRSRLMGKAKTDCQEAVLNDQLKSINFEFINVDQDSE